jgi:hypothetical protein
MPLQVFYQTEFSGPREPIGLRFDTKTRRQSEAG